MHCLFVTVQLPSRHSQITDQKSLMTRHSLTSLLRFVTHLIGRPLLRTLFRLRVENSYVIPRTGPFIIVANHSSHADTAALLASLPMCRIKDTHAVAAHDYFYRQRSIAYLINVTANAVPFDRRIAIRASIRRLRQLLSRGHGLIIFPEGTRSNSASMGEFRHGVGSLLAGYACAAIP